MPFNRKSIDELIERAGLTEEKLAEELGVPKSTVYRWKHVVNSPMMPNIDALYEIAEKYGLNDIEFYQKPETNES